MTRKLFWKKIGCPYNFRTPPLLPPFLVAWTFFVTSLTRSRACDLTESFRLRVQGMGAIGGTAALSFFCRGEPEQQTKLLNTRDQVNWKKLTIYGNFRMGEGDFRPLFTVCRNSRGGGSNLIQTYSVLRIKSVFLIKWGVVNVRNYKGRL